MAVPEGTNANSLEVAVERFLETAKKILVVDGYLQAFLFALERGRGLRMFRLEMNDRAEKHIAIRQVAAFLELLNVDWAIYVGEAWIASARPGLRHAIDAADRREAISVVGVANDERFCNRWIEFTRTRTKILLGDDHTDTIPANMLLPILAAIRKREESKTASAQPQGNEKWDQVGCRSNSG